MALTMPEHVFGVKEESIEQVFAWRGVVEVAWREQTFGGTL
jgi:hypothetical protein